MTVHQFTVRDLAGKEVSLSRYKGKVLLIVNTASQCGFTPQLASLEKIYRKYKDRGFEILGFPSNDFGSQEPLEGNAIADFCRENYEVTFPVFGKVHVKGKDACDLYKFLSDKKLNGKVSSIPRWNFHKYLIDKEGRVVDYFYTITTPDAPRLTRKIEKLLQ
ncbi:MAG TPA: glutathione peroxidase [Chitinophagales bacterium]|nr:glutathione peroxidase [Chitinophagales bacterium]